MILSLTLIHKRSPEMLIAPEKHEDLEVLVRQIGSFVPQNVFALAEEALHGGTGGHRCVELHEQL
jgi:hypothetical protein